jgi:hypothetical protein
MPARFVGVHDDCEFTDALAEKLRNKDVAWFTDPLKLRRGSWRHSQLA